jgi:formylglycine-generating enzyme required for sulfatase activity
MRRRWQNPMALVSVGALAIAACNALAGLDADFVLEGDGGASGADRPNVPSDGAAGEDGDVDPPATDGGDGGVADADADARIPACPGKVGMVDVGGYCIDATEVTQAQYAGFLSALLADGAARPTLPLSCSWKVAFTPSVSGSCRWDPGVTPNVPVVCVDWCDALAYCRWAGKRLCGSIQGGPIPWNVGKDQNANEDQWFRACSAAGTRAFPYGATFVANTCNSVETGNGRVIDAGAMQGCVGGYPGLHDMVGNAFEWQDSCSANAGRDDNCSVRGGSWAKDASVYSNCTAVGRGDMRDDRWDDIGIRCCAP